MRKFAHVINPFAGSLRSSAFVAQPATIDSMRQARRFAAGEVEVDLLAVTHGDDQVFLPPDFARLPALDRTVLDMAEFEVPRPLPLLEDILWRAYEGSVGAEFLVYTNADIGLQPSFYRFIDDVVDQGYDAFIVNRRTLEGGFGVVADLPRAWATPGAQHPGLDCFIFPRAWVPKLGLAGICLGAARVGFGLALRMAHHADRFRIFTEVSQTFHWGNDRQWQDPRLKDYARHNERAVAAIVAGLPTLERVKRSPHLRECLKAWGFIAAEPEPNDYLSRARRSVVGSLRRLDRRVLRGSVAQIRQELLGLRTRLRSADKPDPAEPPLIAGGHLGRVRPDDLLIASFPRSGNTWMRFLLGHLMNPYTRLSFRTIAHHMPSVYTRGAPPPLLHGGRRFIKTHDAAFHLFPKTLYLVRDVRDVLISYFHYERQQAGFEMTLEEFIRSDRARSPTRHAGPGLTWSQHVRSALRFQADHPERLYVVGYEELLAEPAVTLAGICDAFDVPATPDQIVAAIEKSSFPALSAMEARGNPEVATMPQVKFFRPGRSGQWKDVLTDADLDYVNTFAGPMMRALGYADAAGGDAAGVTPQRVIPTLV